MTDEANKAETSVKQDERGAFIANQGYDRPEIEGAAQEAWDYHRKTWNAALAHAASTSANVAQGAEHPDDVAVDRFAVAMKEKLAAARAKGRSGWQQCSPFVLSEMLRAHVDKGDPRDVANFCMMLWNLDWSIAAPPAQTAQPVVAWMDSSDPDDATAFTRDADEAHCNSDTFSVALVASGGAK